MKHPYCSIFKLIFFISIWVISMGSLYAQNAISGKITDYESGKPIEGVIVIVSPVTDSNELLGYGTTNDSGEYAFVITGTETACIVSASIINYKKEHRTVDASVSIKLDFKMQQQITSLKEVIIKEPRVSQGHDTISYKVGSFANATDRTIGDILKKLPGIDVTDNGTILYNGKAINKFYIEGLNLLDSKYGLAVNNISYKDVENVEVLENHQSIKALKSTVATDRAAINLKLKKAAKGRWLGNMETSAGAAPFLWNISGLAMLIGSARQSLNVIKTNNSGQNILQDLESHTLQDLINGQENNIDVNSPLNLTFSQPPIRMERLYFNKTLVANTSNIRKLKHDFEFKTNISFSFDKVQHLQDGSNVYLLPDSNNVKRELTINERVNTIQNDAGFTAMFNLNKNVESYYLNDKLNASVGLNTSNVYTSGSKPNEQLGHLPAHFLENDFNLIKVIAGKTIKLNSYARFDYLPQQLSVFYQDPPKPVVQKINEHSFFNHTNVSFGTGIKKWHVDYTFGVKMKLQSLFSRLDENKDLANLGVSKSNDFSWNVLECYAKTVLNYSNDRINFNVELPFRYNDVRLQNYQDKNSQSGNYFFVSPIGQLQYKISPYFSLNARGSLLNNLDDISRLNDGFILSNYRTVNLGNPTVVTELKRNCSLDITYRNPLMAVFSSILISYLSGVNGKIISTGFYNVISLNQEQVVSNPMSVFNVSGRLSKGIDTWKTTATILLNYSVTKGEILQAGQLLNNTIRAVEIAPKFVLTPAKWVTIEYDAGFKDNQLEIVGLSSTKPLWSMRQYLQIAYNQKKWSAQAGSEYFYNQLSAQNEVASFFLDVNFKYEVSKKIELSLQGTNILNSRLYGSTVLSDGNVASNYYNVRPLNILAGMYIRW